MMDKAIIQVTTHPFGASGDKPRQILERQQEWEIRYNPYGRRVKSHEVPELVRDAWGIIAGTEPINIKKYPKLKIISRYGTGLDNINLHECKNKNILVYNTPDAPTQSVAELALLMMLQLLRINKKQLNGKSIGIIGFGRIGFRLSQLLNGFNCTIYHHDPDRCPATSSNLELIFSCCDIITLHVPLNNSTYRLIGKKELNMMEKSPIIINTSRWSVVNEFSILDALIDGKISGFGSDVNHKDLFKDMNNVIITNHIGSDTIKCRELMERKTVDNLIKGLNEQKI